MDSSYYKKYEPIFGSWYIVEKIGEGSFGEVFVIERNELGVTYRSALKTIRIPQNPSEKQSMLVDGMSRDNITQYYRGIVQDIINEFILMSKLKGNSNIVSYEDHVIMEHGDGIGWDILIRMELLTPLYTHILNNKMTKKDIVRFGIDMCRALELCEKNIIIHRDIKPENIFISSNGDYKLGDFGVARTMEETVSELSKKGTYLYMAPEVYRGEKYGASVDIYSLGIVMYKLLNNNRTPFMPPYPEQVTYTQKKESLDRRMKGELIPEPQNGTKRLNEIVLKACAFKPEDRYQTATEMKSELEKLMIEITQKKENSVKEDSPIINEEKESDQPKIDGAIKTDTKVKTVSLDFKRKAVIIAAAVAVITAVVIFAVIPKKVTDITGLAPETTIYIGDTLTPQYGIIPEKFNDTEIKFDVEDDEVITVDKKGSIVANRLGQSVLTLSAKGYKEEVIVKVVAKITKISNVDKTINLTEGESYRLKPKLLPEKFADEQITYKIKNKKIATVTAKGKIKALKPGKTTLTISAGGCSKVVTIKVKEYIAPQTTNYYTPSYNSNYTYNQKYSGNSSGSSKKSSSGSSSDSAEKSALGPSEADLEAEILDEEDWSNEN